MDSFDIFKQLTRGVKFTKKNPTTKKQNFNRENIKQNENNSFDEFEVKEEIKSEGSYDLDGEENEQAPDLYNLMLQKTTKAGYYENDDDDYIKDEIIDDDYNEHYQSNIKFKEDEYRMNLIDDHSVPHNKKKQPKKSPEELKVINEETQRKQLLKQNKIHIRGRNPTPPIGNFETLINDYKVSPLIVKNLVKCGYKSPTAIQMQAIPSMLAGHSIMACAPTGSGKTAAFLVPIIHALKFPQKKGYRALILCPTRELAKQTHRECLRLTDGIGLKVHTMSKAHRGDTMYSLDSTKKFDILVSTPSRICYLLKQEPAVLNLEYIEWLILDEADKLFDESGVNPFRVQFDNIYKACTNKLKLFGLFSATYTHPVSMWSRKHSKQLQTIIIGATNSATDLIEQELLFVGTESGKLIAIRDLIRKGIQPPVLVFVQTKDRAEQLFKELIYDGINVDVIHSDRSQLQRDNVIKAFREGTIWVLICTDLMGRGIDFKGVNLVVNYDFPPSGISYIHRIGRTGRNNRRGKAITYFTQNDTVNLRSIAQIMKNSGCHVPDYMLAMKKISKKTRRFMEKTAPERDFIATNPNYKFLRKNADETTNQKKSKEVTCKEILEKNKKQIEKEKLQLIKKKNKKLNSNDSENNNYQDNKSKNKRKMESNGGPPNKKKMKKLI